MRTIYVFSIHRIRDGESIRFVETTPHVDRLQRAMKRAFVLDAVFQVFPEQVSDEVFQCMADSERSQFRAAGNWYFGLPS